MATKLATIPGLGPTAVHVVYTEPREGWRMDDSIVVVPTHPIVPPAIPKPPSLPRADRRETAPDYGWGWVSLALVLALVVPWLVGVGWIVTQVMLAVRGWLL
jgi:hypothetical protein